MSQSVKFELSGRYYKYIIICYTLTPWGNSQIVILENIIHYYNLKVNGNEINVDTNIGLFSDRQYP